MSTKTVNICELPSIDKLTKETIEVEEFVDRGLRLCVMEPYSRTFILLMNEKTLNDLKTQNYVSNTIFNAPYATFRGHHVGIANWLKYGEVKFVEI